jgi:hypothetical protein
MRWRAALLIGTVAIVVLATAAPAAAKGADQATITGPGLAHPIVVGGDGEPGSGEPGSGEKLGELSDGSGLFAAIFGADGSSQALTSQAPAGPLGPKYELAYRIPDQTAAGTTVRQDLYPSAAGGPVTYTKPGQVVFGLPSRGGWYRAPGTFGALMRTLGVPLGSVVPSGTPSAGPAGGAVAGQTSGSSGRGTPWMAIVAGVLVACVALVGVAVVFLRRRMITQS